MKRFKGVRALVAAVVAIALVALVSCGKVQDQQSAVGPPPLKGATATSIVDEPVYETNYDEVTTNAGSVIDDGADSLETMMGEFDAIEGALGWETGPIDALVMLATDLVFGLIALFSWIFGGQTNPCMLPGGTATVTFCFKMNPAPGSAAEKNVVEYSDAALAVRAPHVTTFAGVEAGTSSAFSVKNLGSQPVSGLTVTLKTQAAIPGLSYKDVDPVSGGGDCVLDGLNITCSGLDPIESGQTAYFRFTAAADDKTPPLQSTTQATASAVDISDTNFGSIRVVAGPVMASQSFPARMVQGQPYTDKVTIKNLSASSTALAVEVKQTFDPPVKLTSVTVAKSKPAAQRKKNPKNSPTCQIALNVATCTVAQIDKQDSYTMNVGFTAPTGTTLAQSKVTVTSDDNPYSTVKSVAFDWPGPAYVTNNTNSRNMQLPDPSSPDLPCSETTINPASGGTFSGVLAGKSIQNIGGTVGYSTGAWQGSVGVTNVNLSNTQAVTGDVTVNYTKSPYPFPMKPLSGTLTGQLLSDDNLVGTLNFPNGIGECTLNISMTNQAQTPAAKAFFENSIVSHAVVPTGSWKNQDIVGGSIVAVFQRPGQPIAPVPADVVGSVLLEDGSTLPVSGARLNVYGAQVGLTASIGGTEVTCMQGEGDLSPDGLMGLLSLTCPNTGNLTLTTPR